MDLRMNLMLLRMVLQRDCTWKGNVDFAAMLVVAHDAPKLRVNSVRTADTAVRTAETTVELLRCYAAQRG